MAFVKSCQPGPHSRRGESSLEAGTGGIGAVAAPRWLKLCACIALGCWWPGNAQAQARSFAVPLQCRIDSTAWRSCRMVVDQVGRHWYLELEDLRIEFRHDGDGRIHMLRQAATWQDVDSHWEEGSLCWGQVCAKGEIPLD